MAKLEQKFGGPPIWNVTTVHRKFLLKNPTKTWPYKEKKLFNAKQWRDDIEFTRALANTAVFGTRFVACIKLENMKVIDENQRTRLNDFRKRFKSAFIWTMISGLSENHLSVSDAEIYIPELEYDIRHKINQPLRIVFQNKLF